ncbi:hypothetical protein [Cryobacterium sp. M25]|uniref:hypothetical protein n=1 Tax=Cryobacterium sp. M25 TaxID=2048293 RepID=UPI000CE42AB0|nr:hypothetical protein [Cryobacterium sp. M25]
MIEFGRTVLKYAVSAVAVGAVVWIFVSLPVSLKAPLAGAVALLLVPVVTYFTTHALDLGRSRESAIRIQKNQIYDDLMAGMLDMLGMGPTGTKYTPEQIQVLFADATPRLMTYGSRSVILAWNAFRQETAKAGRSNQSILFAFEDLLMALRSDLGHAGRRHQRGEILGMFVTDIASLLPATKPSRHTGWKLLFGRTSR